MVVRQPVLSAFDPIKANDDQRLAHNCYLRVISVPDEEIKIPLQNDNEKTELTLEQIGFAATVEDLIGYRLNDLVFEDNFNEKILTMASGGKFTYDKLFSVCSKYGMKQHQLRCEEKYEYFTKLGFSNEEAKSNVLAIAFYTGSKSETIKSVL
jgi:hypothetical protein